MEARLRGAVSDGDFYTAHQLLLSHSQRLERAGKVGASKDFLVLGIRLLAAADAPRATLSDVLCKYVAVAASLFDQDGAPPAGTRSPHGEEVLAVLCQALAAQPEPVDGWRDVACLATRVAPCRAVVEVLVDAPLDAADAVDFCVSSCASDSAAFVPLARAVSAELLLHAVLALLRVRCFSSANTLVRAYQERWRADPAAAPYPAAVAAASGQDVLEEALPRSQACNLAVLAAELLRREQPPLELFLDLQLRYAALLGADPLLGRRWGGLREAFWPARHHSQQQHPNSSPLASLLQSMLS